MLHSDTFVITANAKNYTRRLGLFAILPLFLCAGTPATRVVRKPSIAWAANPKVPQLERLSAVSPLRFEPNVGQAGPEVRYIARGAGYTLLMTDQEAAILLPTGSSTSAVRMKLVGAASTSASHPQNLLPSVSHYYIGDDPKQWHPNVPNYGRVTFEQVYPGIDLVYYGNQQRLEYDFVLRPGAMPSQIRLAYSGADSMRLDSHGDLILAVRGKELRQRRPLVYQEIGGKRVEVAGGYELTARTGEVRFVVARYDRAKPLIVDPVLVYSTYLGGTGTDLPVGIAVDSAGAAYVIGNTNGGFPTLNAEQNTFGGSSQDAFVAKLGPTGALIYSTYLGGPSLDTAGGIAVDSTGAAYATGQTGGGFPILNAEQSTLGGAFDAFVTKLSPTGTLVYSTYLGGTGDDAANGIAVDSNGAAYVTGKTDGGFPTFNAEQNTFGGGSFDGFVTKLGPSGALVYSTYVGGTGTDQSYGIAVDSAGAAYITGITSGGFPTLNAAQSVFGGGAYDAFVTKLSPTGARIYSTYLGGAGVDQPYAIAVDGTGAAYPVGLTSGAFPTLNAGQGTYGGGAHDAFVVKLGPTGAVVYSTYLGGTGDDQGIGIGVDNKGAAYVTGFTNGGFPTLNAVQSTYGGGTGDAFIANLGPSGALVNSTYLGGTGNDYGIALATDGTGAAYVAGATNSANFPTLNATQSTFGGVQDAFIAKLSGNSVNLVSLNPNSAPAGTASLSLRVNGTGFSSGSAVLWNGSPIATVFVSPTHLTGTVPGALLNTAGSAAVAVGNSIALTFTILPPVVTSLSPQSVGPGSPFTLTVGGSNFVPASTIQWNGGNLVTTFVNSSQLTAMVPGSLVPSSGTVNVAVVSINSTSNALIVIIGTPVLDCVVTAALPPILRPEASTELQGDLLVNCFGGTLGQTLTSDVTVSANVNLTSRILNAGTQATEAELLIDDPAPAQQVLNTTVFQGTLTTPTTITFKSVPIKQPGSGTRILRITNLRGYAHQAQQAGNFIAVSVSAILSMSGAVAISNAQQTTGFLAPTTQFRLGSNVGSLADQRTLAVSFTEEFANAFKTRVASGGQQNIPGTIYFTESGFVNTAVLPTAGLADSATRLMLQLSGVPTGVNVYAPVFPDGSTNAQLVSTDSNGAGPASFIPGTSIFGGKYAQVTVANGSAMAVWEVTAANPAVIETLQFHIVLTGMTQAGTGSIGFTGSLAPLSAVSTATAGDPVPRIAADSVTHFVNLALASNSTAASSTGALALPGLRPSGLPQTIRTLAGTPQVQVGSNLSFVYGLTNNGPGPAPGVTVQSNLPPTLSYVDCAISAGGVCSAAANPDGSTTVTGTYANSVQPGQSPNFIVHAQPLSAAAGTTLSVSTVVSSGMEESDPSDNALVTSFGVTNNAVTVPVNFSTNPSGLKVQVGANAAQVNPVAMVDQAAPITFTAPSPQSDPLGTSTKQYVFNSWSDGTVSAAHASVTPPIGGGSFTANFDAQYKVSAASSPAAGGAVSVSPAAASNFYTAYAPVMLTATPAAGYAFAGFTGDVTSTTNPLSMVIAAAPLNIQANFVANVFAASPGAVQFGATPGGALLTSPQVINVQASPGVAWSASANQNFISVSPASGMGNGSFTISILPSALPASGSASGMVMLTAPNSGTSPVVNVTVAMGASAKPFGSFDTPVDGTTNIAGAVPVTGWALDSIEVVKVDIWREPVAGESAGANGLVYIGDAVLVAGARPDVQTANPSVPLNYRAGWGYLLLTNFLPGNNGGTAGLGSGTYKLHAIAHNKGGSLLDLGTRTITTDNAHASKPFGTIDTPGQGTGISGKSYVNFGWALTQNPYAIALDGSTIQAYVDGVAQPGHITYNNFRSDISTLFPGYANSGGAVGYYVLDTTQLTNAVHTIFWIAYDNQNRGEGLGSRYFSVFNTGSPAAAPADEPIAPVEDVKFRHGYNPKSKLLSLEPDARGVIVIDVAELDRIELHLGAKSGYSRVNGTRAPLPIGSALKGGVFYWHLGPGFTSAYGLVFERPDGTGIQIEVKVRPKT